MRFLVSVILTLFVVATVSAQRRITPIDNPNTATQHVNENYNPDSINRANLVEMTDAHGRKILIDTVAGTEVVDSAALQVVPKMEYPFAYAASLGVNIWDPVMRLLGQKHGLIEFQGEFNMHNRYIAVFQAGLGEANNTPDDNNYTYKSAMAPFFKIGLNYNFLYNSSSDYMAMAGIRYGYSPFTFKLTDVTIDSPYWQEESPMTVPSQTVNAGYFELMFNLRIRISGPIYLGWSFIFHKILHETPTPYGKPWYIPGYGTRNMPITGAFSVTYTFDLHKKKKARAGGLYDMDPFGYPDDLPELHEGDDPTVVPHYHPEEENNTPPSTGTEEPVIIVEDPVA